MNFKRYHVSRNLFDENNMNIGYWITSNGTVSSATYGAITNKLPLNDFDLTVYFYGTIPYSCSICWFRGSSLISRSHVPYNVIQAEELFTAPNNADSFIFQLSISSTEGDVITQEDINSFKCMLNEGTTPLPYEPYGDTWLDVPHYIMGTSTDTITTLPADIYANDTTATVGLKGNMEQTGTPTPTTPIMPQGCGDLETTGEHTGQYKIPISSAGQTTPVYLGEVESTRKIRKYEFTGQENISLYNAARLLGFQYLMGAMQNNMRTNGLCTHFIPQITGSGSTRDGITFGANNQYLYFTFSADTISEYSLTDEESISSFLRAQYAAGTPVTVWYVLATETTGIVNEPLMKIGYYADEVSGITIPTIAGANTLSVGTTLQPSEVSVTYKGWHPVQSVHERDNGAWD